MQIKKISYLDLSSDYRPLRKKILSIMDEICFSGEHVPGKYIEILEKKISKFLKVKYCATLNSGTDALMFALHVLNFKRGDEIITTPNTWYSTVAAITHLGLVPKFIDVKSDHNMNENLIEKNINKKTKGIIGVHLNGKMLNVKKINNICKKYKIKFIEDAAQAFGSSYHNVFPGQLSDIACFSTHPTKIFSSYSDGGFVVSKKKELIKRIKLLRNHGLKNRDECEEFGMNSRMDNLQSRILIEKLKFINSKILKRKKIANLYRKHLKDSVFRCVTDEPNIINNNQFFAVYCKNRDKIYNYLINKGIEVKKYFHIPMYQQKSFKKLFKKNFYLANSESLQKELLNLPIRENLSENEIIYICRLMNNFYKN